MSRLHIRDGFRFYVSVPLVCIVLILSNTYTSLVWYKMGYRKGSEVPHNQEQVDRWKKATESLRESNDRKERELLK